MGHGGVGGVGCCCAGRGRLGAGPARPRARPHTAARVRPHRLPSRQRLPGCSADGIGTAPAGRAPPCPAATLPAADPPPNAAELPRRGHGPPQGAAHLPCAAATVPAAHWCPTVCVCVQRCPGEGSATVVAGGWPGLWGEAAAARSARRGAQKRHRERCKGPEGLRGVAGLRTTSFLPCSTRTTV